MIWRRPHEQALDDEVPRPVPQMLGNTVARSGDGIRFDCSELRIGNRVAQVSRQSADGALDRRIVRQLVVVGHRVLRHGDRRRGERAVPPALHLHTVVASPTSGKVVRLGRPALAGVAQ